MAAKDFGSSVEPQLPWPSTMRIAVGEILRHVHHGLVAGRIAVRMKLADDIADGARRFLVLGARREAELAHGVDDAPLHGLQAVAQVRQRPVQDHVHRIVEVGALCEGLQGLLLDAFEIQFLVFHDDIAR